MSSCDEIINNLNKNKMDLKQDYRELKNKDVYADECCVKPNASYSDDYVRWLEEQLLIPRVVWQSEQLHKLLQHLSDEDELVGGRTHQQIVEGFKKLV